MWVECIFRNFWRRQIDLYTHYSSGLPRYPREQEEGYIRIYTCEDASGVYAPKEETGGNPYKCPLAVRTILSTTACDYYTLVTSVRCTV